MTNLFLKFFIFLVPLLLMSYMNPKYLSPAEENVDRLMMKVEKNLVDKYDLHCIRVAVGMPGGIVQMLGWRFQIIGPLSKEEIRSLLVNSSQDFVNYVNADNGIKPFLKSDPFKIENVENVMFFIQPDGGDLEHPYISVAGLRQGTIYYRTTKIVGKILKDVTEERETYEEALKAVQKTPQQDEHPHNIQSPIYRDQLKYRISSFINGEPSK